MHMIRNAIDHGIEPRDERLRVGKPPVGTIALNAFQKGNHVVIEVEDDGRGMDPEALLAAAVRRGVVSPEEAKELGPRELLALVFMPGFTTKEVATDLSGRGVGLDVAKTNIAKLGGVVDITSDVGIGTKMTITLPITLAIINVLLVEIGARLFAVPLASVEEAIALDRARCGPSRAARCSPCAGRRCPSAASRACSGSPPRFRARSPRAFVVIAQVGNRRLGFVVDELVGQQDIVIKALGKSLAKVRGFAGATELGDQRVALVLDVAALIEEVLAPGETRFLGDDRRRREGLSRGGAGQGPLRKAGRSARRRRRAARRVPGVRARRGDLRRAHRARGGDPPPAPHHGGPQGAGRRRRRDQRSRQAGHGDRPAPPLPAPRGARRSQDAHPARRRGHGRDARACWSTRCTRSGGSPPRRSSPPASSGASSRPHIAGIGRPAGSGGTILILLDLRPILESA
jgi:chemotaxis signal transduction protein